MSPRFIGRASLVGLLFGVRLSAAGDYMPATYKDLYARSDLVVIAESGSTQDTKELKDMLVPAGSFHLRGVSTTFRVELVLKGDKTLNSIVLQHYRDAAETNSTLPNASWLVAFQGSSRWARYILFLKREPDGRYAPATGQQNAHRSIIYFDDPGIAASLQHRLTDVSQHLKQYSECMYRVLKTMPGLSGAKLGEDMTNGQVLPFLEYSPAEWANFKGRIRFKIESSPEDGMYFMATITGEEPESLITGRVLREWESQCGVLATVLSL